MLGRNLASILLSISLADSPIKVLEANTRRSPSPGVSAPFNVIIVKERYWQDALNWLSEQDLEIKNPTQRPAFISWWDYGFYEVALGEHPTVADNFQDGIPVAANFHTATSEKEAVSVWIIRLLEGIKNKVSDKTKVTYVKGCNVLGTGLNEIKKARKAAKSADVAVVVVGENERKGRITKKQARNHPQKNVLTRALGYLDNNKEIDTFITKVRSRDIYLFCSDGLYSMLEDEEILTTIESIQDGSLYKIGISLILKANLSGGYDNITVILISFSELEEH